jgi:hypothetical protein
MYSIVVRLKVEELTSSPLTLFRPLFRIYSSSLPQVLWRNGPSSMMLSHRTCRRMLASSNVSPYLLAGFGDDYVI